MRPRQDARFIPRDGDRVQRHENTVYNFYFSQFLALATLEMRGLGGPCPTMSAMPPPDFSYCKRSLWRAVKDDEENYVYAIAL